MRSFDQPQDEIRIKFFTAIQKKDVSEVERLLKENNQLISSRTKSKNSSPLHIAAEANNEAICKLLLDNAHETNPVDNDGKTPYQRTKSDNIKKLIVEKHKIFLCEKQYVCKSQLGEKVNDPQVLSKDD